MKKLLASLVILAAFSFAACNNEKKADTTTDTTEKVENPAKAAESMTTAAFVAKAHACGPDCKDGSHVYAHGDIGHTCTDACGNAHTCTDKCKDGKHTYAHGESGHTCTEDCAKM